MIDYGKQKSTVCPEPLVIDEQSVWMNSNIEAIEENEFVGFEFNMVQYEKDEYIKMMSEKNVSLERQLTDTQIALCEIYEGMVV